MGRQVEWIDSADRPHGSLIMETPPNTAIRQGPSWKTIILITLGVFVLGIGIATATTAWWVKKNIYASPIQPVSLTASEQQALEAKLQVLETSAAPQAQPAVSPGEQERTLVITAKEINAYLAQQNLGDTVTVDLGNGSLAATMIVPIPADSGLPLLSGTTLRLRLALAAAMDENKKLAVKVTDVRLGGVPMPNAWLGDVKGVNLVGENLEKDPALQRFFAGIQEMEIRPDGLRVVLNE